MTPSLDYYDQLAQLLRDPVYWGGSAPRGNMAPVLLIPGFLTGDWTLTVMAGWLKRIGYRPYLSGIDWNVGAPHTTGEVLGQRLAYVARNEDSPVLVIGHSLGGMLARVLASQSPKVVSHVVALGSPIRSSPHTVHPLVRLAFLTLQSLWGTNVLPDLTAFFQNVASPLPRGVRFTAIFSRRDEIVDWHTCLDPQGDNRQVSGRHLGLVVNREVYRLLGSILSSPSKSPISLVQRQYKKEDNSRILNGASSLSSLMHSSGKSDLPKAS